MRRLIPILLFAFLEFASNAAEQVTAIITITNTTANGDYLTVNSDTRRWSNSVPSASWILTGTSNVAATNLYLNIAGSPYLSPTLLVNQSSSNAVTLRGSAVAVTIGGSWATVSLSTQQVTAVYALLVPPYSVTGTTNRTNNANWIVQYINDYATTNAFNTNASALTNFVQVGNGPNQRILGKKVFDSLSGTNAGLTNGTYYAPLITNGTIFATNGFLQSFYLSGVSMTNGINYGPNAFRSPGAGAYSEQFGSGATASGDYSFAAGYGAKATNTYSISIGYGSQSYSESGLTIGTGASVFTNSLGGVALGSASLVHNSPGGVSLGYSSSVQNATNGIAIGNGATAVYSDSVSIGLSAAATTTNQIRLGIASSWTSIPGTLQVSGNITNSHLVGTNTLQGTIGFKRYALSSLANGNNAAIPIKTNTFVEVSGPTAAFTINGIDSTGVHDGQFLIILNQTTYNMTIAHDSGVDATAANRIYTMTGADRSTTGNGAAMLIYNSNSSRWILISLDQ